MAFFKKYQIKILALALTLISVGAFWYYFHAGLTLAYSDSQSHLNIARRVVDSLTPGLAQIGSIWLPLPHFLMLPTIGIDFMWHTGLSGTLVSMAAYVATGVLLYKLLLEVGVGALGRIIGVAVFALNPNILYLQSTAMTELLLLATMTASVYQFLLWKKRGSIGALVRSSFWAMLSTLVRYEGWFLLAVEAVLVLFPAHGRDRKRTEGDFILFCALGGFGIILWLLWNWAIFGDPLYFAFGQFSAHTQQENFSANGLLVTQGNALLSAKIYSIAVLFIIGWPIAFLVLFGVVASRFRVYVNRSSLFVLILLFAPFAFNILALYLGHTILFMPHILGAGWFNVRYGVMCVPFVAACSAIAVDFWNQYIRIFIALLVVLAVAFSFSYEPVTLQDAKEGVARKDLQTAGYELARYAGNNPNDLILISAAANDPIVFLSGFPIRRFIYEGSGAYWKKSLENPEVYASYVFVDKKNSMDFIAEHLWKEGKLDRQFEQVYEDEWFLVFRIRDPLVHIEEPTNPTS